MQNLKKNIQWLIIVFPTLLLFCFVSFICRFDITCRFQFRCVTCGFFQFVVVRTFHTRFQFVCRILIFLSFYECPRIVVYGRYCRFLIFSLIDCRFATLLLLLTMPYFSLLSSFYRPVVYPCHCRFLSIGVSSMPVLFYCRLFLLLSSIYYIVVFSIHVTCNTISHIIQESITLLKLLNCIMFCLRVTKENRAAGILDNFEEGEKYAQHSLRKFVRNKPSQIMPSINKWFSEPNL